MCIYKRMFESENKILTKEGVIHFLELYDGKSLPYSPELSEVKASQPLPDYISVSATRDLLLREKQEWASCQSR